MKSGQLYAYRVNGPVEPSRGLRFDPTKVLIDPYGRGVVVPKDYTPAAAAPRAGDNTATAMKSVVVDSSAYDWEGDVPLRRPSVRTVIYETRQGLHLSPQLRREGADSRHLRRAEKISYLKDLGITAVELPPIHAFDTQAYSAARQLLGLPVRLVLAPHLQYSSNRDPLGPVNEFRYGEALHRAGIEVIPRRRLHNHTAEGNHDGLRSATAESTTRPTTSSKMAANDTGLLRLRTVNANHPVVRRMIVTACGTWVTEMHVDGFRFDLASILSRDLTAIRYRTAGAVGHRVGPGRWLVPLIAEPWTLLDCIRGSSVGDLMEGMERAVSRRCPDFFRGEPGSVGSSPTGCSVPRSLRPQGARGRAEHQLRDLPRRVQPQRSRLVQRKHN